ncbi:hypothetical protein ONZ51_g7542 [Trametes cubensis]|uniref:C2H2-type domain-containing protein n=1 Tax=Trametes cubensis TaxID=1111947 RepID=A0AAD7TSH9_9APHY|nr:hypothetical protein ONZ51_g7542 [Trametes cubensis]
MEKTAEALLQGRTRSGARYSPWAAPLRGPVHVDFDLAPLMKAAEDAAQASLSSNIPDEDDPILESCPIPPDAGTSPSWSPLTNESHACGSDGTHTGDSQRQQPSARSSGLNTASDRDKRRSKARRSARRAKDVATRPSNSAGPRQAKLVALKRLRGQRTINANLDMSGATRSRSGDGRGESFVAGAGFVGQRLPLTEDSQRRISKDQALSMGFRLIEWDGKVVLHEAEDALIWARSALRLDSKKSKHRRGRYAAITCGISYGGGQRRPGNLAQTAHNRNIINQLLRNTAIQRLAGFGDACLRLYAPRLYRYYSDTMDALCRDNCELRRNFRRGVFGAATFNLGPKVVTYVHTDHQNLPSGWCAVTPLGDFDYKKGGHLLLWDLKLIVEFPPGSLILLPSAVLRHSNATIAPHEHRFSFTQFSAGGLFRWVECGCRSQKAFSAEGNVLAMSGVERWLRGVEMWSTWTILQSPESEGFPCPVPGCQRTLRNRTGYSQHIRRVHPEFHGSPRLLRHSPTSTEASSSDGHSQSEVSSDENVDITPLASPPNRIPRADVGNLPSGTAASSPESIIDMSSNVNEPRTMTEDPPTDHTASDASDAESSSAGYQSESSFSDQTDWQDGEDNDLPALLPLSDESEDEQDEDDLSAAVAPAPFEADARPQRAHFHPCYDYDAPAQEHNELDEESHIEFDEGEGDPPLSNRGSSDGHELHEPSAFDHPRLPTFTAGTPSLGPFNGDRFFESPPPLDGERDYDTLEEPSSPSGLSSDADLTRKTTQELHPQINGSVCDAEGHHVVDEASVQAVPAADSDWTPYSNRLQFETAELLYANEQMSAANIDRLLELWEASLLPHDQPPPFKNHVDLYRTINTTALRDVRWQCFTVRYPRRDVPQRDPPPWMLDEHEVWYRDVRAIVKQMLSNPDFKGKIAYAPYREFDLDGSRWLRDFMSGEWAWRQADILAKNEQNHGASFVPIILGSDKTTVSVATGQNDYYPLYVSIGNVDNSIRRAHRNAVALAAFLAIPHTTRQFNDDAKFRKFRRQLFHTSISRILSSLKDYMESPDVVLCNDRKCYAFERPYIADYPEQALLTSIVQGWCPTCTAPSKNLDGPGSGRRSREHTELLVKDFELGELWEDYGLVGDVVPFTNDFPRADIHELIAPDILHQLVKGTFKDHLVAWVELHLREKHGKAGADEILSDVDRRQVMSKFVAFSLGQMLLTNQRMDKLSASRVDFESRRMLTRSHIDSVKSQYDPNGLHAKAKRGRPKKQAVVHDDGTNGEDSNDSETVEGPQFLANTTLSAGKQRISAGGLTSALATPTLIDMIRRFLFHQLHPDSQRSGSTLPIEDCPPLDADAVLYLHFSAEATFYAPSDTSGTAGMRREYIRATPTWRKKHPRYDCVFINRNSALPGLLGMDVGRVKAFISFKRVGSSPEEDTGMWIVKPAMLRGRLPLLSVIHVDTIYRAAHLVGVSMNKAIPLEVDHHNALDYFDSFYVNKYIDHNAFELLHVP